MRKFSGGMKKISFHGHSFFLILNGCNLIWNEYILKVMQLFASSADPTADHEKAFCRAFALVVPE